MKKYLSFALAVITLFSLCSCGGGDVPVTEPSDGITENSSYSVLTTNSQGFFHFSHNFSDDMKIDGDRSTAVCLCAKHKDGAEFIVSASLYDDEFSPGKCESLAISVKKREDSSSEVSERTFGGIKFYGVCFDSYDYEGKRYLNMFGQTEPFADGTYYFLEISINNMDSDSFLNAAEKELSSLKFF